MFGLALIAELLAIYNQWDHLRYFTKPLLLILLLVFIMRQAVADQKAKNLLIAAALLSLAGDVILLFDHLGSNYFIGGLVSFLLAHVFFNEINNRIQRGAWLKYGGDSELF